MVTHPLLKMQILRGKRQTLQEHKVDFECLLTFFCDPVIAVQAKSKVLLVSKK